MKHLKIKDLESQLVIAASGVFLIVVLLGGIGLLALTVYIRFIILGESQ
jgi:hypothetical protein